MRHLFWNRVPLHRFGNSMWDPGLQWIAVRINGLEVFRSGIDAELTDAHPEWVATAPSFPRVP
jgi:hypothetical protein